MAIQLLPFIYLNNFVKITRESILFCHSFKEVYMLKTFKPILDANPDALIIVNEIGKIVFTNPQAEKLFGYDHDELQNILLEQLMPERYRKQHQNHRIGFFQKPRVRPMGGELELYGCKKSGEEFPVEISLSPLDSDEGKLAMAAVRDVTKRKNFLTLWKIEREYHQNQFNFIAILEATPDALIVINASGKIIFANIQSERLFGYSRIELQDMLVEQLMPERYRQRHQSHRKGYFNDPRFRPMGKNLELYGLKKMGEEFPVEISLSPLECEEGILTMASIRDVTLRKNQALLQIEREYNQKQSNFIAYLCHELRNPISGIQGSVNIIKEHFENLPKSLQKPPSLVPMMQNLAQTGSAIAESLNDIDLCMAHIQAILDDSLIITELNENKLQLINNPFDVAQAIYEVSRLLQSKAEYKGLEVKLNLQEEKLWAKGDILRIKQIIFNLGSNAIKFTEKGYIEIMLAVEEQTAKHFQFEIKVTCTGKGLGQDQIDKLFEKIPQFSMGEKYEGSEFGLQIAKKLSDLMDGHLFIESTKGVGITYRFIMQSEVLLAEKKQELQEIKHTTIPSSPIKSLTILIVDDNEINRKILKHNLEKVGHHCLLASDGLKAIEQYIKHSTSIDIILMDILMPELDGLSTTRRIRQLEKENKSSKSHVPIIGLSANSLSTQQQEAFDAGMNAYLTKPYKSEEIFQRIAVLVFSEQAILNTKKNENKNLEEEKVNQSYFWSKNLARKNDFEESSTVYNTDEKNKKKRIEP